MMSSLLRGTLSTTMLFGLATGCASGHARNTPREKSTVTADDIATHPNDPIETLLAAKVPGLLVTRTANGGVSLQIRGASSLDGNNGPLYMMDDMQYEPGPDGELTGVDPYNIESVKVLKGPEAAIYGIRGFNGVIVIKTKRPGKRK